MLANPYLPTQPTALHGDPLNKSQTSSLQGSSDDDDTVSSDELWNMSLSDFIGLPENASPSPNSLIGGKKTKDVPRPSLPNFDDDEEDEDEVCLFAPPSPPVPAATSAKTRRPDTRFRTSAPARLPRRMNSLRGVPPPGMLPRSSSFKNPNGRSKKDLPRRSVSFDKVKIREFERVLGDNPPPSPGPSLALGWNYNEMKEVSIDKFEKHGANGKPRKWGSARNLLGTNKKQSDGDFHMTPEQRIKIAQKLGYSQGEIKKNIREGEKIRQQRNATEYERDIARIVGRRTSC